MTRGGENRFLLVYSSQTGQAQAIAEEIAERSSSHGLHPEMHCIGTTEKKFWLERESCLVFVTSTTGDGEPPDTALKFWRRLKKKTLPSDHLKHLHYALLGLGDSNYTNFCKCGKLFDKRFEELGAKRFYDSGFADDATGLEITVEPWMDDLFPAIRKHLGLPELDSDVDGVPSNSLNVEPPVDHGDNTSAKDATDSIALNASNCSSVHDQSNVGDRTAKDTDTKGNGTQGESPVPSPVVSTPETKIDLSQSQTLSAENPGENHAPVEQEVETLTHSIPPLSESSLTLPAVPPRYIDTKFDSEFCLNLTDMPTQNGYKFPSAASDVQPVPIVAAQVLTREDAVKKSLKISLDISSAGWKYEPGDALGVVCPNCETEVQQIIDRLGWTERADVPCVLSVMEGTKKRNAAVPAHLHPVATIRHWLTTCCDLRSPPKKTLARALVECTDDAAQKRRLQELCSKQGAENYNRCVREAHLGITDILRAFPACFPPLGLLLEQLPRLNARPYSAASCQKRKSGEVDFVFNIVEIPAGSGRHTDRRGVCTGWLDRVSKELQKTPEKASDLDTVTEQMNSITLTAEKIMVPVFLRSNQHFQPPSDLSCPVIMVGPGTGVAPFIGFLQQREVSMESQTDRNTVGETWLFYGCRHEQRDYLFRRDLEHFVEQKTLNELQVCFSRDLTTDSAPHYVQDNIRCHGRRLCELLTGGAAHVYVCGDAKNMAKDVRKAFAEILQHHNEMTLKEAESHLNDMVVHKRYHEDVWA